VDRWMHAHFSESKIMGRDGRSTSVEAAECPEVTCRRKDDLLKVTAPATINKHTALLQNPLLPLARVQ
jgi:hypothetical protein